jgi:hypothetical protein
MSELDDLPTEENEGVVGHALDVFVNTVPDMMVKDKEKFYDDIRKIKEIEDDGEEGIDLDEDEINEEDNGYDGYDGEDIEFSDNGEFDDIGSQPPDFDEEEETGEDVEMEEEERDPFSVSSLPKSYSQSHFPSERNSTTLQKDMEYDRVSRAEIISGQREKYKKRFKAYEAFGIETIEKFDDNTPLQTMVDEDERIRATKVMEILSELGRGAFNFIAKFIEYGYEGILMLYNWWFHGKAKRPKNHMLKGWSKDFGRAVDESTYDFLFLDIYLEYQTYIDDIGPIKKSLFTIGFSAVHYASLEKTASFFADQLSEDEAGDDDIASISDKTEDLESEFSDYLSEDN